MVSKGYEILADASFNIGKNIGVVMIFGDFYVFLSIVDDFLS